MGIRCRTNCSSFIVASYLVWRRKKWNQSFRLTCQFKRKNMFINKALHRDSDLSSLIRRNVLGWPSFRSVFNVRDICHVFVCIFRADWGWIGRLQQRRQFFLEPSARGWRKELYNRALPAALSLLWSWNYHKEKLLVQGNLLSPSFLHTSQLTQ